MVASLRPLREQVSSKSDLIFLSSRCTCRVRMKEFEEAIPMGRANAEAIKRTRRHCRHARIEMVGGSQAVSSHARLRT